MKAEITTKEKAFEPIEVKITIESKKELECLISCTNVSTVEINRYRLEGMNEIKGSTAQSIYSSLGCELIEYWSK